MDQLPQSFERVATRYVAEDETNVYRKYLRVNDTDGDDLKSDEEDSDDSDDDELPISHEFKIPSNSNKPINCLAFSTSSDRLITASKDYSLNIYNFNDIYSNSDKPSRLVEPFETKFIQYFQINKQNDKILALPNASFFKILDINGKELQHFSFGDQYIYDVKKTTGHVDMLTSCDWNPEDSDKFITSSNDSTFRIWDLVKSKQIGINFIKNTAGKKLKIEHVKYIKRSQNIVSIDDQERVLIWDSNSNFHRPTHEIKSSSKPSSILPVNESQMLIRSSNDLKLYDLRNPTNPMIQRLNLPTIQTNAPLVVDQDYILCETSSESSPFELHILDKSDLMSIKKITKPSEIKSLDWDSTTNQIAVGESNGQVSILFDPVMSSKGIMTSLRNKPKKRNVDESYSFIGRSTGYNLNELAELNKSRKKKRVNDDEDIENRKLKLVWGTTKPE